jgi:transposase
VTRRQLTDEQWKFIEHYLPIGRFGPYPERLRDQFEGVIWRFRSGAQWREMPSEFGPWPTVYGRFRVWRDADVFTALLEGLIAEAARQGEADLFLVSVDSTTACAHHDAAGIHRQGGRGRPEAVRNQPVGASRLAGAAARRSAAAR